MHNKQHRTLLICLIFSSLIPGCASNKSDRLSSDPSSEVNYISFQFKVHDGTVYSDEAYVMNVDVIPAQDAQTASNNTLTGEEDVPYAFSVTDFNFHDVDGDPLTQIKITSRGSAGSLKLNGEMVGLDGVITAADINAGNLTFEPEPDAYGEGYSSFRFAVHDGTEYSVSDYTATINVTAVNDEPISANQNVSINEKNAYIFRSDDFTFVDNDGDAMSKIQIVSLQGMGHLKLNGVDVSANDDIAAADLNAGTLAFEPTVTGSDTNAKGPTGFQFKVHDGSQYSMDIYTMTVDVITTNNLPSATDNTVTMKEDTAYVFATTDFTFSDPDGDLMTQIQITSLASVGNLKLNGEKVSLNEIILVDDIATGRLIFESVLDAIGIEYDRFSFRVHDGKGYSASEYIMTINITAANDAPTAVNNTVSTNEDSVYVFTPDDFHFTDVDGDSMTQIQITSLDLIGAVKLNGVDVAINDVISIDDIRAGKLTFEPQSDWNGSVGITFSLSDEKGRTVSPATLTLNIEPIMGNTRVAIQPANRE